MKPLFIIMIFIVKLLMNLRKLKNTLIFEITREDIIDSIGENYVDIILFSIYKSVVEHNLHLHDIINEENINDLYDFFKIVRYKKKRKNQ